MRKKIFTTRGVDRVPARYRVVKPAPTWVHQHQPQVGFFGRQPMTPYVNPLRDLKRHARLRKELRFDTSVSLFECSHCDARFGIAGSLVTDDHWVAQEYFDGEVRRHETGACVDATTAVAR